MNISTEELKERISHLQERLKDMRQHKYPADCPNAAAYLESLKAEKQQDIYLLTELLAVREAQPVEVTDEMAMAFHRALTDSDIGSDDLDDIKIGLRGALCNYTAPPAPAVPNEKTFEQIAQETDDGIGGYSIRDCVVAAHWWNACRAAMLQPVSKGYTLNSPVIQEGRSAIPNGQPALPDDYFSTLVNAARLAADKAMRKHPQPNYVLLKVAEEAGEVVQAGVHYAEGRMTWQDLEGEIVQLLAMLIRLVTEGDQVNGITPPLPAASQ